LFFINCNPVGKRDLLYYPLAQETAYQVRGFNHPCLSVFICG